MCEVFSTSWGFLVDFKRFLFVQFVGRRANNLGQSDGKKILNFTRILLWFSMDFFFHSTRKSTSKILEKL